MEKTKKWPLKTKVSSYRQYQNTNISQGRFRVFGKTFRIFCSQFTNSVVTRDDSKGLKSKDYGLLKQYGSAYR